MGLLEDAKSKIKEASGLIFVKGDEQAAEPLYDEAERLLQQALIKEENNTDVHLTYARLLRERKRFAEAETYYQYIQQHDPTNERIRIESEENRQKINQPDDSTLVGIAEITPSSAQSAMLDMTIPEQFVEIPQVVPDTIGPSAAESGEEDIEISSSDADENWAWGCLLKDEQGDLEGAEEAFRKALEYDSRHQPTLKTYSLLLLEQGRYSEAENYLTQLAELDPSAVDDCFTLLPVEIRSSASLLALRANLYIRQGKHSEAEPLLRQALEHEPERVEWIVTYVQLLSDLDQTEAAIKRLRQAFDQNLQAAALHREYARLIARLGRYDEVETHLKQALAIEPNDPDTLALQSELQDKLTAYQKARGRMALAIMKARQGLATEARKLFKEALEIESEHLPTLKAYANFLEQQQEFAEAEQIWAMVATKAPEEAEMHFQTVLKTRGETPTSLNSLARVLVQFSRIAEAETHLRRSLALDPSRADTLELLVDVLHQQRSHEAETLLHDNQGTVSNNPKLSLRYAQLLAARYNYTEAKKYYQKAQELDPADDEIAQACAAAAERIKRFEQANLDMALGRMEAQSGNYAEAERLFQQALAIDPNHVPTLSRYAGLLEDIGRPVEAGERLSQLAQLDPVAAEEHYRTRLPYLENNPESRCAYALLLQHLGRSSEAMEQFHLTLKSRPTYLPALVPYVNAQLDEGKVKPAEAALMLALRQDDSTAEIHWHYAKLLANYRHRYDLASSHFEQAVNMADRPEYQEAYDQIKTKLEQIREAEYEWALALLPETDPMEANARFAKAYSLCPDHIPILVDYSKFLRQQGQLKEARRYLEEAHHLDPYDDEITQSLNEANTSLPEASVSDETEPDNADLLQVDVITSPQVQNEENSNNERAG